MCAAPGCGAPSRKRGLCEGHYKQLQRTGRIGTLKRNTQTCTTAGCGKVVNRLGLCLKHHRDVHGVTTAEDRQQQSHEMIQRLGDKLRDDPTGWGRVVPAEHPVGVDVLTAAAHALGLTQEDISVLNVKDDPFLCGRPAQIRDANWLKDEIWDRSGWVGGIHPRRAHYTAMGLGVEVPTNGGGRKYASGDNGVRDAKMLYDAASQARYLGLLDPEQFVDRRNSPAVINVHPRNYPPEPGFEWTGSDPDLWSLPSIPTAAKPAYLDLGGGFEVEGYDYDDADQPVLIELWIEKSTMNDVLGPLCRRLGVNLEAGAGFESITKIAEMLRERAVAHDKHTHILYISDYDKEGERMPVAVARQMQFWAQKYGVYLPLTVEVIGLTREQVDEHKLPPDPEHDNRVELDALEALKPGELARIVQRSVLAYRDRNLPANLARAEREAQAAVDEQWEQDAADIRAEVDELRGEVSDVAATYQERLEALAAELDEDLEPYRERLEDLQRRARETIDGTEVELPDRPGPDDVDLDPDGPHLFDSRRHWLWQLAVFKAHQQTNKEQREIDPAA